MNLLLVCDYGDDSYFHQLKPLIVGHKVFIKQSCPTTLYEIKLECQQRNIQSIITTNLQFVKKVLKVDEKAKVTLDDYAGSILHLDNLEVLVLNPLDHLVKVKYAPFLYKRYISKLTNPDNWFKQTEFTWEVATPESLPLLYEMFKKAFIIACDIETVKENLAISCSGYCAGFITPEGTLKSHAVVIPMTDMFMHSWIKKFNQLKAPKIFQNGQYDNQYFIRWNVPVYNWLFDTLNLFHSWYSELPKRLDFITSFSIRDTQFWKNDGKTGNLEDYYRYNAKDTWATLNSFLSLLMEAPPWVLTNYLKEFPQNFVDLQCGLEGILVDTEEQDRLLKIHEPIVEVNRQRLEKMTGVQYFNPGSWKQVLPLVLALGGKKAGLKSTNEKDLAKFAGLHPINQRIVDAILDYRGSNKLLTTYLRAPLLNNRLLYNLNPAGTDTGRRAAKESNFWYEGDKGYGTQIQNIPPEVKSMYIADEGYLLAEPDYAQSEARCVAYMSGEERLIEVVESDKDYHKLNATLFFGVKYEEVTKDLRQLAKRVNHGANYNMGASVLLSTMGLANVLEAKRLLNLPNKMKPLEVCQHLLDTYSRTYPKVKGLWYDNIKYQIQTHKILVSPLGWTRYCFGNPASSKPDLNSYVAHGPQNLSVSIINIGLLRLFLELQSHEFRLKAQIHDSVLFQYLATHEHLVKQAQELLTVPVMVKDVSGKTRELVIRCDLKYGKRRWSDLKD